MNWPCDGHVLPYPPQSIAGDKPPTKEVGGVVRSMLVLKNAFKKELSYVLRCLIQPKIELGIINPKGEV